METIRGKMSHDLDLTTLQARLANYLSIALDLGTGDGKFAFCHADSFPERFVSVWTRAARTCAIIRA
jgi:hypothetical protein